MSWKYTVGDIVYSVLTGRKMMVLDQIFLEISEYGYKLRLNNYEEKFLYDFEVTDVEPKHKKEVTQEEDNEE